MFYVNVELLTFLGMTMISHTDTKSRHLKILYLSRYKCNIIPGLCSNPFELNLLAFDPSFKLNYVFWNSQKVLIVVLLKFWYFITTLI